MPRTGPTFSTSREIPVTPDEVFAAFSDPERHARWWGPAGFTNTFHRREFKTGGRWSYVMRGPDGRDFPNESVFAEIEPPNRIVVRHDSKPKYRLTIALSASAKGTKVSWSQEFENEKFAAGMEQFLLAANEQNLDRLAAEVAAGA